MSIALHASAITVAADDSRRQGAGRCIDTAAVGVAERGLTQFSAPEKRMFSEAWNWSGLAGGPARPEPRSCDWYSAR